MIPGIATSGFFIGSSTTGGGGGGGTGGGGGGGTGGGTTNPVTLTDQSLSTISAPGFGATVLYSVGSDAKIRDVSNTVLETWLSTGSAANYQVKATLVSGSDTPNGSSESLGVWLSLTSTRIWELSEPASSGGDLTYDCVISVSIRDAASPNAIKATATITLHARTTSLS